MKIFCEKIKIIKNPKGNIFKLLSKKIWRGLFIRD